MTHSCAVVLCVTYNVMTADTAGGTAAPGCKQHINTRKRCCCCSCCPCCASNLLLEAALQAQLGSGVGGAHGVLQQHHSKNNSKYSEQCCDVQRQQVFSAPLQLSFCAKTLVGDLACMAAPYGSCACSCGISMAVEGHETLRHH